MTVYASDSGVRRIVATRRMYRTPTRGRIHEARTEALRRINNRRRRVVRVDGPDAFHTATVNRTHDDQNRLITNGATTITYDKNGNMTLGGSVTYKYDAWNRLAKRNSTVWWLHDALGRRTRGLSAPPGGTTGQDSEQYCVAPPLRMFRKFGTTCQIRRAYAAPILFTNAESWAGDADNEVMTGRRQGQP